jgi:2-polyprenyl-3-methyl-5-hydroxy-6-metoxy-1,4-benzoquinol methylase
MKPGVDFSQIAPEMEEFRRRRSPLIATESVPACPVCGASQYSDYAAGFDYELQTCRNRWQFVQCSGCGHVWLNPRPAVTELGVIYPPTYYAYNYSGINPIARHAKALLDRRKMTKILRSCGRRPHTYLDIGCGDGRFLRVLEKLGVPRSGLYGLELDKGVVKRLQDEGYPDVFCERVEDASEIPEKGIDLITMFHVIEHVDNPATVVRRISSWLSSEGIFALETPNLDSLDARLFHRTYWGGYHIPRHWNLFTPSTIARLLTDAGMEVIATIFQTGHSFWMYSLHHSVRYEGSSRPGLGKWFDPVKSLAGVATFTGIDLLRGALGAKTSAMLVIARKSASTIPGA